MATVTIPLPDAVSEEEARRLLALKLFEADRVSFGQAAEVAGLSKRAFVELLGRHHIPLINTAADDEVARDVTNA
jgi:predicted HTH domain antitoxin